MKLATRFITLCAFLALIGVIATLVVVVMNQTLRQQVSERQQVINQGIRLSQIDTRLANSLATLAVRNNDQEIQELLQEHGFTLNTSLPKSVAPTSPDSK